MARIIGGMFGLELPAAAVTGALPQGANTLLLCNARSALWMVIQKLRPARILLPSYGCPTVLQAIPERFQGRVEYYGIGSDLRVCRADLSKVVPGDLVVLVDYFGWPVSRDLILELQREGAVVLEDACQVLPGALESPADFLVFSPRKFLGVPDGAILVSRGRGDVAQWKTEPVPSTWWGQALRASLLRRDFDRGASSREWFELFRECESNAPVGPYRMSELSALLLTTACDPGMIGALRRLNYRVLLGELSDYAIFTELPDSVIPLGFPLRIENRAAVQHRLYAERIYPAVHWALAETVPSGFQGSHQLSRQILTLPCDQRYEESEMVRMLAVLREVL